MSVQHITPPEVVHGGNDKVVLARTEMANAAQRFGDLASEMINTGNDLSRSIQQGLGPADVWSSPTHKPGFISTCDQLFIAFNNLVEALYENQNGLNRYLNDRQNA